MSYFQAVRLYSALEVCVFTGLLVAYGARRGTFPWALLAATVSPLGPIGSSAGIEYLARRRRVA